MGSSRQQSTSINPHAGHTVAAPKKAMRPFTSERQRPQKKTLPVWAKVSLTTFPLSTGPEVLLVLTTRSLRRFRRRSSYSPLEGTPRIAPVRKDFLSREVRAGQPRKYYVS
jgi:hypothetical protein